MGRWEPNARARLERAAMELYLERGFEQATVADIAARAGLAERTFFRHFADKREALFDGEAGLQEALTAAIAAVPAGRTPSAVLLEAFLSMIPALTQDAELKKRRQQVVLAAPELRERELSKEAHLASCAARALEARGVRGSVAALAATSGVAVLSRARLAWFASASDDYATLLANGFVDLRATHD